MLLTKIDAALELLGELLPRYKRPVVLSSFGKDSMVMLDLLERLSFKPPILFFREPWFPRKYVFADLVIRERNYTVYDYPPRLTWVLAANGTIEIVNQHDGVPGAGPVYIPTGIKPPIQDAPFLCGLEDLYNKPFGTFAFPWDLLLIGHKSSDVDPIHGGVPLRMHYVPGPQALLFPLHDFTDADVWDYTLARGLPINRLRYDEWNGWREFEDITYNPDYFHACTACLDPTQPERVHCPKVNALIRNVSGQVRRLDSSALPSYIGSSEGGK